MGHEESVAALIVDHSSVPVVDDDEAFVNLLVASETKRRCPLRGWVVC